MRTVCNFYSYVLNRAVDISVVVPSVTCPESLGLGGITPSHKLPAKFPVLYLLHGFGNNHAQWLGYSNVEMYAEEQRIAVVTMSAENKAYADAGADDFMRFVDEELPEFVCNYFPVSDKPEESYIAGLSMGGFGALLHGITHPERYRAIGSFSGGVGINPVTFVKDPMGSKGKEAPLPHEYDLAALADDAAAAGRTLPPLYIACGTEDFLFQANVDFRDHLVELGADVTWDEVAGFGHEWRFWDMQVEKFLDWIPRDDVYAKMGKRPV